MITYLLNVALIISTILVFYKVMLRKETFYKLNRAMLMCCLVFAFILPLIHVPQELSFRKGATSSVAAVIIENKASSLLPALPLGATQEAAVYTERQESFFQSFTLTEVLILIYWVGVAVFAINFVVQLLTLFYRAYSRPVIQDGKFRIVELSGDQAPCSFGNSIFINPEKYDWDTYNQILLHEKIHVQQGHSYDIILAELALVFQWFNPFAWLYRKAVEDNLEFLTDNDLLKGEEIDPSSYQLSLVKVSAPHFPLNLTTNYNQSILKKRLIMMNAKKSNINTTWKYLFLVPIMMVFVSLLNEPIASANALSIAVAKKSSALNGMHALKNLDNKGNWFATITGNTINIRFQKEGNENNSSSNTFQLSEFKNLPKNQEGSFAVTRESGTMNFHGKFEGNMGMGTYAFNPDKNFAANLSQEGIRLNKDDDVLVFFILDIKKSYIAMLKRQGFKEVTKDDLIPLVALKVDEPFIHSIKSSGFSGVTLQNLIPLKALGVDQAYVADIKKSGYNDLSVDQLITLKSQGINGDFLRSSRAAGKQSGLNSENSQQFEQVERKEKMEITERQENKEVPEREERHSIENIVAMKSMNIDAAFRNSFRQIGLKVSDEDLIAMKSLGITADYITKIKAAGFRNVETDEVISMKSLGISTDEVKAYQNLGFKNISIDDVISMKSLGITANEIIAYRNLGYKDISIDEVISAKSTGVTPAYISSMKKQGHNFGSVEKYVETKSITSGLK